MNGKSEQITEETGFKNHLQQILSLVNIGIWSYDPKTQLPTWSDHMFTIFGISPNNGPLPYNEHKKFIHPEDWAIFDRAVNNAVQNGVGYKLKLRIMRPDTTLRWIITKCVAIKDVSGNVERLIGAVIDVTDEQKLEKKLETSEFKFKNIFDSAINGILIANNNAEYVYANQAICDMTGYSHEEILSMTLMDITPLPENVNGKELFKEFIKQGKQTGEYQIKKKDGTMITAEYRAVANIAPGLHVSIIDDKTEKKKTENLLKETLDATTDGIWTWNFQSDTLFFSDRYYQMLGYEPQEFDATYENWVDLIHPNDKEKAIATSEEYLTHKPDVYENSFRLRTKKGDYRWVRSKARVVERDDTGDAIRMIGNHEDITEKKQREEELIEKQRLFREAQQIAKIGSWSYDVKNKQLWWSDELYHLYGLNPENTKVGLEHGISMIHPDDRHFAQETFQRAIETGESYNIVYRINKLDGQERYIQGIGRIEKDGLGNIVRVHGTGQDITEKKELGLKFQCIYSLSSELICEADMNTATFTKINPAFLKVLGYSEEELLSKPFIDFIHPDDKQPTQNIIDEQLKKGEKVLSFINRYRCKEGSYVWLDWNSLPIPKEGIIYAVARDITERKIAENEIKETTQSLYKLNENLEDIVFERTVEVEKLLSQKDVFINQLGHDLKNPLGPLINLLPVLGNRETDPEKKEMIEVMYRNAGYMKNLVTKTIELAKLNSPNTVFSFQEVNLSDVVNNVIKTNKMLYQEKQIKIINSIPEDINLNADFVHLQELFNNLLNNSVKFTNNMGKVIISAEKYADTIKVSIKDNGIGMTQDQIDHIFDEFYKVDSSRHDFESSGLGMPICKRIVELHEGEIWVESEGLNQGTTISFTLKSKQSDNDYHEPYSKDNKKIQWIIHEGKEILYFNLTHLTDEDYEPLLEEISSTVVNGGKRDLLVLTNVTDNMFSHESLRKTRKIAKTIKQYIKKSAIIGLTKYQDRFLNALKAISGMRIYNFSSLDEAKEWLVMD